MFDLFSFLDIDVGMGMKKNKNGDESYLSEKPSVGNYACARMPCQ